jgi:glycosyltransferase involved in cell wall biosynthesis
MSAINRCAVGGEPCVSVIVTFLDAEPFLDEAIRSVLAQTWPYWELILVDDGSTDGSTRIAQQYGERFPERIRYLEHRGHANRGISASRNAGVAAARGEYIAFLDGDDVYLPGRLARHVEVLAAHPRVAMAQSCLEYWWNWPDSDGERDDALENPPFGDVQTVVKPPDLLLLLLDTHGATAPGTCSLTVRRDAYLAVGGCEESFRDLYEDQVFVSKLYLEYPVFVMPDVLARYRRHGRSLVGRIGEDALYAVRQPYLEWVATYVRQRGIADARVHGALRRALFEYRRPRLWAIRQLPANVLRELRRIAYAALPPSVARPVGAWWRRHKRQRTRQLLERARADVKKSSREQSSGAPPEPQE